MRKSKKNEVVRMTLNQWESRNARTMRRDDIVEYNVEYNGRMADILRNSAKCVLSVHFVNSNIVLDF